MYVYIYVMRACWLYLGDMIAVCVDLYVHISSISGEIILLNESLTQNSRTYTILKFLFVLPRVQ